MRTRRPGGVLTTLVLALAGGGCAHTSAPIAVPLPPVVAPAPVSYPVGLRILHLSRGPDRPLPTLIFYPAAVRVPVRTAVPPAPGPFPLVIFCHGLSGSAQRYADTLADWAAAGFVVAAPTFPHTSEFTDHFRRPDIVNQPADARFVLGRVARLNETAGDPLWHRLDTDHLGAIGHSAGGYTVTGLFTAGHDPRLRAGIIMAGWGAKGAFAGSPATMLFLQGQADPIVPVASSRRLFSRVPWPKSYVLMRRDSHATYLWPGDVGYDAMNSLVIDFLRWTLEGDLTAWSGLPPMEYPQLR
jgi:dienelactone hydrolase